MLDFKPSYRTPERRNFIKKKKKTKIKRFKDFRDFTIPFLSMNFDLSKNASTRFKRSKD
jgi:hypothetical protein